MKQWKLRESVKKIDADRTRLDVTWTDPETGLKVEWQAVRYHDFPALEWLVYLENTGKKDTPIIENIQSMDLVSRDIISAKQPYRLHTANGDTKSAEQFEPAVAVIDVKTSRTITAGTGRSSQKNFPFFKVETATCTLVGAIGWSGNWAADFTMPEYPQLRMTAGIGRTHFRLHPGERVRTARVLLLEWQGEDKWEANARFRQLIQKHYVARRAGKRPDPTLFCNTTFIEDGFNINQQATAENQIAHIRSYANLGIDALVTDAGWYEGEYPWGAGNWFPMKSKFPEGIDPVAAAAKESGFIYGLWFEPERAVPTSMVGKAHPEWLIHKDDERHLVNFGAPGAPEYFFKLIKGFMDKPGFHFYRQDFNDDPLPYWRILDQSTPDRVGIAEIRYVEGLYAFWDLLAEKYPDSLREECSSGGRRFDLETVMRMHIHQKSDFWFDNETDQASLWSLGQYLPNNTFVCQLRRLDDYSFHSTLASSLCIGWLARDPQFDTPRAQALVKRYKEVRHLLTGAWYPLLPYSRGRDQWIGSQYDRPDLGEGMVLVFRRAESAYRSADLWLHGLEPAASYEILRDSQPEQRLVKTGAELMQGLTVELARPQSSDLITYRKLNK